MLKSLKGRNSNAERRPFNDFWFLYPLFLAAQGGEKDDIPDRGRIGHQHH